MEPEPETYITVKEAAKRIGYSIRQTDRFIKQGKLEAVHINRSLRKVLVASVDAFNARHDRRPVDPLEPIKENLHQQEHVAGDILRQVALLRTEIEGRDAALHKRISDLEGHLRLLKAQLQQEREARQTLEYTLAALSPGMSGAAGSHEEVSQLLHTLLHRAPPRRQLPQEKRGYSPDTIRLVHFAAQHGIEPSTLRQHAERTPGLATIYERPDATTKKREWWLLPSQQSPLLHYWQTQNKAWTPCPDCPHEMVEDLSEMQREGMAAMKTTTERVVVEHFQGISDAKIAQI